ncbi:RagB/SusD family nutrient uptake outer membrane protein [Myroides profundi]|uniref:Starch-binding associating with outer membrane n=1 Tax=Myroides profundi TaxID=480520 RepID=A0AAJ5BDG4_MYRPR|nr:RagB/SusD family nutrient uptake outer membrane protein [Myroides profundi]AJH16364.1 hypothetical protein MPR_3242 [Myroides profundi]SEQ57987.1 Starch-binding associating with outer membrane [Myroides profundi]
MKKIFYSIAVVGLIMTASCSDDFTKTDQESTFSDEKIDKLARFPEAALLLPESIEAGAYYTARASNIGETGTHEDFGQKSIDITMDAMGQDMVFGGNAWFVFHYTYQMRVEGLRGTKMHFYYYSKLAHNANLIMQSIAKYDDNFKNSTVYARALALRGFANFNLMKVFANGDMGIPYEYYDHEGDRKLKQKLNRVPSKEVYQLIESDLLEAYKLLNGYVAPNKGIIDKYVVSGMLSRVYQHTGDWVKSKDYAFKALGENLSAVDFGVVNDGFSNINNPDVMWGSDIDGSSTTIWASFFSHMDTQNQGYGSFNDITKMVDARLYAQINDKDKRKDWFYDGKKTLVSPSLGVTLDANNLAMYSNLKFVDPSRFMGDYIYMRKSEMLLNYAEAAFESGDEGGAKTALDNLMKTRQEDYNVNAFSGESLRQEIRLQRRIELWGEGFAFTDIIRWKVGLDRTKAVTVNGKLIESNHGIVPGTKFDIPAGSDRLRYQFPISEINANSQLRPQNP